MVQERLAPRPSRVRKLAASGAVLACLAVGGTVLAAASAHAAVKPAATAACGFTPLYIPAGDNAMVMSKPGYVVYVLFTPIMLISVPFGYVEAFDEFPGLRGWQSLINSPVQALVPLQVSSFDIKLVFNPLVPGQYSYDVLYNSCEWGPPAIGHVNVN